MQKTASMMFARAVGRFQANRKELEESHDLVLFEAPDNFEISDEQQEACRAVMACLEMRARYQELMPSSHKGQQVDFAAAAKLPRDERQIVTNDDGVLTVADSECLIPSYEQFYADRPALIHFAESGSAKTYCYLRLKLLEHRFDCYLQLNKARELDQTKNDRMDWSKVAKVSLH